MFGAGLGRKGVALRSRLAQLCYALCCFDFGARTLSLTKQGHRVLRGVQDSAPTADGHTATLHFEGEHILFSMYFAPNVMSVISLTIFSTYIHV